jgi:hypothetical protein
MAIQSASVRSYVTFSAACDEHTLISLVYLERSCLRNLFSRERPRAVEQFVNLLAETASAVPSPIGAHSIRQNDPDGLSNYTKLILEQLFTNWAQWRCVMDVTREAIHW